MKVINKSILCFLLISSYLVFCGMSFLKTSVTIDTEENKVYKQYSIDNVYSNLDKKDFIEKFDGEVCCVSGTVKEIKKNKIVIGSEETYKTITCDASNVSDIIQNINVNDQVRVLGTAGADLLGNEIHLKADEIIKNPNSRKTGDLYFLKNGASIDRSQMQECELNDGKIKYFVPKHWKAEGVELNIEENGIGYVEGYQYVLNKITGSKVPESFFVCYFKYKDGLRRDTSRSNPKPIEKAIAENIEGDKILKFPSKHVNTYYDAKYDYYLGQYSDKLQVKNSYDTEYIFIQDGEDGLVMFLYVYDEPIHLDDVMFVTRFLKIN